MKQSTLFSIVGNATAHKLSSKSDSTSAVTNKENVELKKTEIVSINENGNSLHNIETVGKDSEVEVSKSQNPNIQFGKINKEVISYADFINESKEDCISSLKTKEDGVDLEKNKIVDSKMDKSVKSKGDCDNQCETESLINNGSESNEERDKQSMSYEDFLGMFKPASVSENATNPDGGDHQTVVDSDKEESKTSVVPPKREGVNCKSITSFFKPVSKGKNVTSTKNTKGSSTFTVTADIHIVPSSESEGESPQKRLRKKTEQGDSKKSPNALATKGHNDMGEIVLISSVIDNSPSETATKKRKFENGDANKESHLGLKLKKKKCSTTLCQSDKHLDKGICKTADATIGKSPPSSGQCKLSFGASGLKITREMPKPAVDNVLSENVTGSSVDDVTKTNDVHHVESKEKKSKLKGKNLKLKSGVKENKEDSEREVELNLKQPASEDVVDDNSSDCQKAISRNQPDEIVDSSSTERRKCGRLKLRQPKTTELEITSESQNCSRENLTEKCDKSSKTAKLKEISESQNSDKEKLIEECEKSPKAAKLKETSEPQNLEKGKPKEECEKSPKTAKLKEKSEPQNLGKEKLKEECEESPKTPKLKETSTEQKLKESDKTADDAVVVVDDGVSSPMLRRSSRIRNNADSAKKMEVVELDHDEHEDEKKNTRKGRNEKEKQKKSANVVDLTSDQPNESSSSKVPRKLAPIFTRLKQPQPEAVKPPPPPTPEELEKFRARREFLMSGIPEELKRAKAALDLQTLTDYPPFPCPSHVCQMEQSDVTGDGNVVERNDTLHQRLRPDLVSGGFDDVILKWDSLGWTTDPVWKQADNCQKLLFQDFTSHPVLDQRQIDGLIQELQGRDKAFPFRETFQLFSASAKDVTEVKDNPTPSSTSQDEVIVVDDIIQPSNTDGISNAKTSSNSNGILWTDEHPVSSKLFVGNSKSLNQLKDWLLQWQEELKREAKKALRGNKSSKDTRKKSHDWSDDSDFTDSSEEDCRLCNTMLITGPHGVGKTSAVYCLAKEMGFKVFEVNPTSLRSGKQLQSQLEEATQSHRVAGSSNTSSGMFGTPPAGTPKPKLVQETARPIEKPPACKAFSAFFKPSAKKTEVTKKSDVTENPKKESKKKSAESKPSKTEKKKRKNAGGAKEDETEKGLSSGDICINPLNLTSASIILIDEADVVLEEDKGFLSTVQQFMSSTKIPIVITASHPAIHSELSPRHEHINLKQPSTKTLSSFLHTVCLARDGVRVDHESLKHIVSTLNHDIRQCLLFLQFWCRSGGGRCQIKSELPLSSNSFKLESTNSKVSSDLKSEDSVSVTSDYSNDSDFLSLRPARKRQKRMCLVDDDDDSNSNFSNNGASSNKLKQLENSDPPVKETGSCDGENADTALLPLVHNGCATSYIGGHSTDRSISLTVRDLIKESAQDLSGALDIITHLKNLLPCHLVYNMTLHCCRLPKSNPLPVRLELEKPKNKELPKKKRKRIMIGDWLDSDGSDDEGNKDGVENDRIPSPSEMEVTDSVDSHSNGKNVEETLNPETNNSEKECDNEVGKNLNVIQSESKKSQSLTTKLLNVLSRFYESNSFVQSLYDACGESTHEDDKRCLLPGVSDEEILKEGTECDSNRALGLEICGCADLLSARTLVTGLDACIDGGEGDDKIVNLSQDDHWEEMNSLPIGNQMPDLWMQDRSIADIDQDASTKNVASCVGSGSHSSRSPLHLDYMPLLREMCRFEHERQTTNAKRRFNHYFDYIGLNVRESTRVSLANTYSIARN